MATFRYYVALMMLVFVPPAILFWFSIHPFIRFWRRVGVRGSLAIHYAGMLGLAGILYSIADSWLKVEFGTQPPLIAIAVLLLAVSAVLRRRISQKLAFPILTGVPELSPERHQTPLLTAGIYSRIRHPRYVQFLLGIAGYACFCNYLATYVLLVATALTILLLVRIEERELRERFGPAYDAYSARVPRFIPKRVSG